MHRKILAAPIARHIPVPAMRPQHPVAAMNTFLYISCLLFILNIQKIKLYLFLLEKN